MKRTALRRRSPIRRNKRVLAGEVTNRMLDDACRAVVFARDGHKCRRTGSTAHLQWAHVISRRYFSVRWDPDNSMCLSAGAHLWWHHQPVEAVTWWVGQVGNEMYAALRSRMMSGNKIDRKMLLLWLQSELKKYR